MRSAFRPLLSVTTYRRWTFLLGGTAILVPYLLIYLGLLQIVGSARRAASTQVRSARCSPSSAPATVPAP